MNRSVLLLALALLLPFASACHAIGDTFHCLHHDTASETKSCEENQRDARERERDAEIAGGGQRARDQALQAHLEYRAAIGRCNAGDARACFVTALYEDRHGASSSKVEPRYRFACDAGDIGRACFLAGAHARARIRTDVSDEHSPESTTARDLALASFSRGCELRDGESCRAGLDLDPTRIDLVEAACAAHYGWACAQLGR